MKRILILNWRSLSDPLAGGAERATFEHARRWVKNHGAKVTWLSSRYDKKKSETIEGVCFEYIGFPLTRNVFKIFFTFPIYYLLVFWTYLTKFRGKVDVVIDEVHGLPHLSPLFAKEKIVVYVHEVAGSIWDLMYPFPINIIGKNLEKTFYLIYRFKNIAFVTVSDSTKNDLINIGIDVKNINIVNNGVSSPILEKPTQKEKNLTVIFVNRLVKMKGIERALKILSLLLKEKPQAKLWVVGRAELEYQARLEGICKKLLIQDNVKFYGFVDEQKKRELMSNAHVLINPSFKEGWGLVNIEANACGTPVVAFDVGGNVDSIRNYINGMIVHNDLEMVEAIIELFTQNPIYSMKSLQYSKSFDWDINSVLFYEKL